MGGTFEILTLNAGLALLALAASRPGLSALATTGAGLGLIGASMALAKAWGYAALGRLVG